MKLPYIRPSTEEEKIRRRELDEHMKSRPLSPCIDQTPEDIERYYRTEPEGSLAAVRHTQYHTLQYVLTTIRDRRPGGRIGIEGAGDFYMRSGKNCFHPTGQTKLVVPTAP
ncbi:hypothetical protein JOD31_000665 [Methylopila capsulata]|uniref:Uncharacterized protein n=1 Tax=Methylopila capsulata TaxID=61654 RepID=A0A9W6IUA3_9HYPH|nr:hypothetical protein [Methylopila capsulata]MBM7850453.1 hypothetical protein [Methylopila capsulata]GLK55747.1 hypothetical protein GCM10008170_17660 [Methylopila capsulata]